jgi:hypothetical protein
LKIKTVPTLLKSSLHIGEQDHPKPKDGSDSQTNVSNVYEHVFTHNSASSSSVAVAPITAKEGKNPLVNVAFSLMILK